MTAPTNNRLLVILMLLLLLASGAVAGGWRLGWWTLPEQPTPAGPSQQGVTRVYALGVIDPLHGVLHLGTPVPDRIDQVKVHEGETVAEGQVLVVLATRVDAETALALARAQLDEAEKRVEQVKKSGQTQIRLAQLQLEKVQKIDAQEISAQKLKIDLLNLELANARSTLDRVKAIPGNTISTQEREKAELQVKQAQSAVEVGENALQRLKQGQELAIKLAEEQVQVARDTVQNTLAQIPLESLRSQVEQARSRLDQTSLKAPTRGKVLQIHAHKGELVGPPQPILLLADTDHMIVLAEVYETDIRKVALGQKAVVTSHVLGETKIIGKVIHIGSSVARNTVLGINPRATVDNRVIQVKIELLESKPVVDLIGLQVKVEIEVNPAAVE